jgi:cell division protein FtsL
MVGQMFDRPIQNFPVQRPVREENSRETWLFAVVICLLVLLALMYLYIPNQMVDLDYRLETAKKAMGQIEQERSVLVMQESELTTLSRLEDEARKLGFQRPDIQSVRFIDATRDQSRNR